MAKKFIQLKKQISGIEDIKETVKALEKIAAANVHRLKITSQRMKDYEKLLKKIFYDIPEKSISNPLFRKYRALRRLKIILATEKGLCGNILNRLLNYFQATLKEGSDEIMVLGEKGKKLLEERGLKINYFFHIPKDIPQERDTREIKKLILSRFLSERYNQVLIFYPSFKTLAWQKPESLIFLPLLQERFEAETKGEGVEISLGEPIYEPSQKEIIDYLIKEYLGLVFYQKILETKLSELSARTMAMETASEKAKNLLFQLSHQYFRVKREAATKEINDLYSHRLSQQF